jgi:hypothetical protein
MTGFDSKRQMAQDKVAQPEQEPVARVVSTAPDRIWLDLGFDPQDEYEIIFHELHDVTWSQDNASGNGIEYVRADTVPPAAQPAQEPEVWGMRSKDGQIYDVICPKEHAVLEGSYKVPLYTTPQQRPWVGLTDEERFAIGEKLGLADVAWSDLMQAIESALRSKNT